MREPGYTLWLKVRKEKTLLWVFMVRQVRKVSEGRMNETTKKREHNKPKKTILYLIYDNNNRISYIMGL